MYYKVFIPSAGLGSRLGNISKNLNKALASIANKPAISYIIDKIPKEIEIVVAVGYKKDTLKQFFSVAYPDRIITIVDISPYEGDGSGLGHTLLECKKHLQCPFIFCSNDTIITEDIPEPNENWIGFSRQNTNANYRTLKIKDDLVSHLLEKGNPGIDLYPYIGLAGIHNYDSFWKDMEYGKKFGSIVEGESYAIKKLLFNDKVQAKEFTWFDIGNVDGLNKASLYFSSDINVLPKSDEAIWFVDNKVIKYSNDTNFITNRVLRTKYLNGFIPSITKYSNNMYSYDRISGKPLSSIYNLSTFDRLLQVLFNDFWKLTNHEVNCQQFYFEKTEDRVRQYLNVNKRDCDEIINGQHTPSINTVLSKVNWNSLLNGVESTYHGDLHLENILLADDGNFVFLDWRQDFQGNLQLGDIYYDFAKLNHGLIVNHQIVNSNNFSIDIHDDNINFDICVPYRLIEYQKSLKDEIIKRGFDWDKVELLTSLIFLNIAPLHHTPYNHLLFYLGKYMLWRLIN